MGFYNRVPFKGLGFRVYFKGSWDLVSKVKSRL